MTKAQSNRGIEMRSMPFCQKCGRELPEDSNFCPNCGTSLSEPARDETRTEEKACPKCGTIMRSGFMVERDSPLSLWTIGQGIYWTPGEGGLMGERIAIRAYACPQCGYIEHYIRRLEKDRKTILSAPTKHEEE